MTDRLSWLINLIGHRAPAEDGDNIGYWIGAKGGYRLARAQGHRVRGCQAIAVILGAVAVVVIADVIVLIRRQTGRIASRAEDVYPGPLD